LVVWDSVYLVKPSIDRGIDPSLYKTLFAESTTVDLEAIVWLVSMGDTSTLWVIYGSLYLSADVLGMEWK
jgi:hypothetical protein